MYNKILAAKQKATVPEEESGILPKPKPFVDLAEAENIVKQQLILNKLHSVLCDQDFGAAH